MCGVGWTNAEGFGLSLKYEVFANAFKKYYYCEHFSLLLSLYQDKKEEKNILILFTRYQENTRGCPLYFEIDFLLPKVRSLLKFYFASKKPCIGPRVPAAVAIRLKLLTFVYPD